MCKKKDKFLKLLLISFYTATFFSQNQEKNTPNFSLLGIASPSLGHEAPRPH
jgi:hypothetical protein